MSLRRIVVLTDGHSDPIGAKTAVCLLRYCPNEVVGILDAKSAGKTAEEVLGVGGATPIAATFAELPSADTLAIGIAPSGGRIPAHWNPMLIEAIQRRMNIVNGLHEFLRDDPQLVALAREFGVTLHDVRWNDEHDVARGKDIRRDCLRLLTVGQDCSIGKMVVAVELTRALQRSGQDAKFLATGQTGIMVSGEGCPVDRVISDFLAGAVEKMLLANQQHEILVFEGQGSLSHPKYSAVTLGLMHGSRPQGMIFCYEAGRTHVHGMPHVPLRSIAELLTAYEQTARLVAPTSIVAVAANTRRLSPHAAMEEIRRVESEFGLPTCDVIRQGADRLAQEVMARREELVSMEWA
jgi:uncharacterized NAD-dependent epimerase/dehydratase family protein